MHTSYTQYLMAPPIKRAKSVIVCLKQVLQDVSLEAPSVIVKSPSFQSWMEALQSYWNSHGELHLGVTPFHFWLGNVAWDEGVEDVEECLSSWLYRAGIRSLTFSPDFVESQALWLVVVLGQWTCHRPRLDLVSLLWTRSFQGFSYKEYNPVDESVVWDGWELEEIVRGLYALQEHDPSQLWNFTPNNKPGLQVKPQSSSEDLQAFLGDSFTREEKEAWQTLLFEEEEELPLRASDLLLLVLIHCKKPEDIEPMESWLLPIASSLLESQMWHELSFFVEDLQRMEGHLPEAIQSYAKAMATQVVDILCQPKSLMLVTQHLMKWLGLTPDEQEGLRMYLRLLASHEENMLDRLAKMQTRNSRQQLRDFIALQILGDVPGGANT